jgi:hypothetical protein
MPGYRFAHPGYSHYSTERLADSWFETRGVAALLTMRTES